ncbi:MAG: hypothetical protein J5885_01085 [Clostridia bacterium]|nr:hypothetical protein [Clostridia bacterium]
MKKLLIVMLLIALLLAVASCGNEGVENGTTTAFDAETTTEPVNGEETTTAPNDERTTMSVFDMPPGEETAGWGDLHRAS